jgi:hypothetical protein
LKKKTALTKGKQKNDMCQGECQTPIYLDSTVQPFFEIQEKDRGHLVKLFSQKETSFGPFYN